MAERWGDWLRPAEADLEHARRSLASGDHEWACFAAQQAAEKAVKSLHLARGQEAWGHSPREPSPTPRPSLPSVEECYRGNRVRVFRLDQEGVLARLRTAAEAMLARRPEVIEVRLFGSLARGQARPGSDADLLVTVEHATEPFPDRSPSLAYHLSAVGVGCDLLVYTEAELARMRGEGNGFLRAVETEAIVLARRDRSRHQ